MLKVFLIFLVIVTLFSCSYNPPRVEREYYADPRTLKTERVVFSDDKLNYDEINYHPNGAMKSKGNVINGKKEGQWDYWYDDETLDYSVSYTQGRIDFGNPMRKISDIKIVADSLYTGKPSVYKTSNIYPSENFWVENAKVISKNNTNYIIPQGDNIVAFYFEQLKEIPVSDARKAAILALVDSQNESPDNLVIYSTREVRISTMWIYP